MALLPHFVSLSSHMTVFVIVRYYFSVSMHYFPSWIQWDFRYCWEGYDIRWLIKVFNIELKSPSHIRKYLIMNNCIIFKKLLCNKTYIYHVNKPLYQFYIVGKGGTAPTKSSPLCHGFVLSGLEYVIKCFLFSFFV